MEALNPLNYEERLNEATTDIDVADAEAGNWQAIFYRAIKRQQTLYLAHPQWAAPSPIDEIARALWEQKHWDDLTRLCWLTRRCSDNESLLNAFNNGDGEVDNG